jgi:hypothetical protein
MGTLVSILNVLNDKLRDTTQEAKRRLRSGHRMIMAKTKLKPECYIKDGPQCTTRRISAVAIGILCLPPSRVRFLEFNLRLCAPLSGKTRLVDSNHEHHRTVCVVL